MFCDQCGNQCKEDAKFCGKCGFHFQGSTAPQATPTTPPPVQQAPKPAQPAPPPVQQAPKPAQPAPPPVQQAPKSAKTTPPPVQQPAQQMPSAQQSASSGSNPMATVAISILICAIMAAGAGGAYYFGSQTGEDSSNSARESTSTSNDRDSTPDHDGDISDERSSSDIATDNSSNNSTVSAPGSSTPSAEATDNAAASAAPLEIPEEVVEENTSSEYIIPNSNSQYLTSDDLIGLTLAELALARNEIYARHGREFTNEEYSAWFNSKTWYQDIYPKYAPSTFDAMSSPLSDIELKNIDVIKAREAVLG